jgi:hypothetical protein
MTIYKRVYFKVTVVGILFFAFANLIQAQTVGVFFDSNVPQIKFAAEEVKKALESKKITVEMLGLAGSNFAYANDKVVIAMASNTAILGMLTSQGSTPPQGLGEQAYCLRTTSKAKKTYWVIGGDANGAMYGGFQIAENINKNGLSGTYNNQEAAAIVRRGIKLNLPFDAVSGTYGKDVTSAKTAAIPNVWDMTFWTSWFDAMAKNRYNVISVWSNHPFTSMIKMTDYPDVAIQNVTGLDSYRKQLSIDEKIVFWKKVMAYAHSRGFEFYLFNWNIWTDGATGKYGITDNKEKAATSQATIDYMRKCTSTLWETYPDLDGFGITQGEHVSDNDHDNALFLGKTYGAGTLDYAKKNPNRKIRLVHRWHLADFKEIKENFGDLMALPNINFQMSFKYSLAHMYSTPLPQRMTFEHINPLVAAGLKSFLTVRNDDFFYHDWGDPDYARTYVNGMINKGDWFAGFYMGQDSYSPTRTFFSKNSVTQGMLDIQRQWYMHMLWGRLSYNPNTPDTVFKDLLAQKYPKISSEKLFTAWQNSSRCLTTLGELICGTLGRDNQWWPEACQAIDLGETVGKVNAFLTIADFAAAKPTIGSSFASIANTASTDLKGKKSAFTIADEMEANATATLSFVKGIKVNANTEFGVMINNIKTMSYLSMYYAYKVRAAIYSKQENKKAETRDALGKAYSWWIQYANLMDLNFTGMQLARSANLPDWHYQDANVLKEYTDQGGIGAPKFNK